MTASAHDFITPTTLSTLSKNPVLTKFTHDDATWNNHVDLGTWADAFVIAPASANTIARMAHGHCDNLLLAVYLSARCPVFFAPAMDLDMLQHPATQKNIQVLKKYGNIVLDPGHGELASGLIGLGRMAEPEEILNQLAGYFSSKKKLKGKRVLVTAGPTHEAIDPVRFIGNNSSGKMGYAIAEELLRHGAEVTLVTGPTSLTTSSAIKSRKVTSAEEMYKACIEEFSQIDIAVLSAAVADYRPSKVASQKIKKIEGAPTIKLSRTTDIAAQLGQRKKNGQLIIGFALETENELENARKKIKEKNFDLIVLNSLNDNGAGFGHDTNKIRLIDKSGGVKEFSLKSKKEVAADIVNAIIDINHA
jgi:phosphopantothenoylcysteine decarboxylase/phosphopantothenate--cysteine ligase